MNVTVTIDTSRWEAAARQFVTRLGYSADRVLREQTMLLAADCIRVTPPFSSGSGLNDKATGERSVSRNLLRAVTPAYRLKFDNRTLADAWKRIVEAGEPMVAYSFLQRIKGFKGWMVKPFTPALHRQQLDRRGRAHSGHTITFDFTEWRNYLATLIRRVGLMRSGWLAAYVQCGGQLGRIPDWVTRHGTGAVGGVQINTKAQNPFIEVANWSKGVRAYKNAVNRALQRRSRSMAKRLAQQLNRAAKQAGLSKWNMESTYSYDAGSDTYTLTN